MALLELVNDLRRLLREDPVTSVSVTATDVVVQVALVNRAARRVLSRRAWSFLNRDDGYLFLPGSVATTFSVTSLGTTAITAGLSTLQQESFSDGFVSTKLYFPTSDFPTTSYRIPSWLFDFPATLTLATPFHGTSNSVASGTLFVNEVVLPNTVARVLSIRTEEGSPLRFDTVDSFDDFDRAFPQDVERFAETPEYVAVGGHAIATERTGNPATARAAMAGLGVRIFPPASADILLRYSYVRRVTDLAEDEDELEGVSQEVQDHVVNWAFYMALYSNIEDDTPRARDRRVDLETEYRDLASSDRVDVGRRHVPAPFANRQMPSWRRWQFDTIPEP